MKNATDAMKESHIPDFLASVLVHFLIVCVDAPLFLYGYRLVIAYISSYFFQFLCHDS